MDYVVNVKKDNILILIIFVEIAASNVKIVFRHNLAKSKLN